MHPRACLLLIFWLFLPAMAAAQKTRQQIEDSLFFSRSYPYVLPVLGEKAHKRGYRVQKPFGIMVNTVWVEQSLTVDDFQVGFGNLTQEAPRPELIDIYQIVKFDQVKTHTNAWNIRADVWLLPFLNVYGLYGRSETTDVDTKMVQPFPLKIHTDASGYFVGYGTVVAGKLGPLFLSANLNQNYNHGNNLRNTMKISIMGFRGGPVIKFPKRPEMMLTLWAGAMHTKFHGETLGTTYTAKLAPDAPAEVDRMSQELDQWYDGLNRLDQIKYKLVYEALGNGLDGLKDGVQNTYIDYSITKSMERPWNMLFGVQWEINDSWQIRAESHFLGSRWAGMFSANYRFGIRGHNWFSKKP